MRCLRYRVPQPPQHGGRTLCSYKLHMTRFADALHIQHNPKTMVPQAATAAAHA